MVFGETVMESDTALRALIPTLDSLTDTLTGQQGETKTTALIFTPSDFMICRALDASPHEEQATSIKCLIKIGELMNTYPHLNIHLLWLPRSAPFVGFKRA